MVTNILPKDEKKIEVLFINVPTSYEQNVIPDDEAPPFGLLRIVVAARELYGKQAAILDAHNLKLSAEDIKREIQLSNPKIIGLNPTSVNIKEAKIISQFCEEKNIPYIIGGVVATLDPGLAKMDFPGAFAIVRGSGEIVINEILDTLENPEKKSNGHGIYYKGDSIEGRNDYAREIDLDELPIIDQSIYVSRPVRRYVQTIDGREIALKELSLFETRGCPFSCNFCSSPVMHPEMHEYGIKKYSRPSTEKIAKEIKLNIHNLDINAIHFVDDMAFSTKKHIDEFCQELDKENLLGRIWWRMMSRIDFIDNMPDEYIKLMKRFGLWRLGFGIESGDQAILDAMNKKIRVEQIERVLSRVKDNGLDVKAFFMMGFPDETKRQLENTRRMIIRLSEKGLIDDMALFQLKPYPGTKIFESIKEKPDVIKKLTYLRTEGGVKGESETERIFGSTSWLPDDLKISQMQSGYVRKKIEETYKEFNDKKTPNNEFGNNFIK